MLYSIIVVVMVCITQNKAAVLYSIIVVVMHHPKQGGSAVQYNCGGGGDVSLKTRRQCCTV